MIVSLHPQTQGQVLPVGQLKLLYELLLLHGELLQRRGRLLLVGRLKKVRLLYEVELKLLLKLLHRLLQLLAT